MHRDLRGLLGILMVLVESKNLYCYVQQPNAQMSKVYKEFKAKNLAKPEKGDLWAVVTDDKEEITIAHVPTWIKHPKGVAEALSRSLTNSKFSLVDLI